MLGRQLNVAPERFPSVLMTRAVDRLECVEAITLYKENYRE